MKEQGPGVYANQLAQRGFVALAIDPSYNGESGGTPRHVTSPEIFAEDFSAGVDFLGTLPYVDREQIGAIGICGSGGFALNAAQMDRRIKAVATAAMYDISGVARDGWFYQGSDEDRGAALDGLAQQRWADVDAGEPALDGGLFPSEVPPEGAPNPIVGEFWEFYVEGEGRGWHPRSIGAFTATSGLAHINFGPARYLDTISPRPILLITGDQAHSAWFSEKVHEQAAEPKELVVVPGARHIDLYDDVTLIPFDKLESFFTEALDPAGQLAKTN
ncbi:alpha/beta hydrolase [Microbacterium sp. NPDC096154]|uniref:alpha/beta hydrolase n=1 Tax=Microbacterium sp. NPDC096154 TaxID=3155549 RepID=UPI00332943BA